MPRIAIIGSGPIGLEAALYARALDHTILLLERAPRPAANVADWHFVRLFSPWRLNTTPLGLAAASQPDLPPDHCPTGRELRDRYLLPIANSLSDHLRLNTAVLAVGKDDLLKSDDIAKPSRATHPFRLLLRDAQGRESVEHADIVLDCSGVYGHHRFAGQGGIPAPGELQLQSRIRYTLPDVLGADRGSFADRHTLLMGCGYSAATVLRDLQQLVKQAPQTRVTWAVRRTGAALHSLRDDPLPQRQALVQSMLQLTDRPPAWLDFLSTASLEAVEPRDPGFRVHLRSTLGHQRIDADQLVCLVGYSPDDSIYRQLQVHLCYATGGPIKLAAALLGATSQDCLTAVSALTPDALQNPEPDFFILGSKSYGTNSHFLLQTGHQQVRDAFRILHNDPTLDLYALKEPQTNPPPAATSSPSTART